MEMLYCITVVCFFLCLFFLIIDVSCSCKQRFTIGSKYGVKLGRMDSTSLRSTDNRQGGQLSNIRTAYRAWQPLVPNLSVCINPKPNCLFSLAITGTASSAMSSKTISCRCGHANHPFVKCCVSFKLASGPFSRQSVTMTLTIRFKSSDLSKHYLRLQDCTALACTRLS